ncbi:Vacuolar protein sorting-associated protein 35 [Dillenia turbinata]|uniref:Vacuolar protein sorting-associated protein 35 n=1 Tax=Dillenia turbinata TaxID=194707 RepID=A0AAN8WFF6_9MAGN
MAFRIRDYEAEEEAHSLPRLRTDFHPLASSSPSPKVDDDVVEHEKSEFFDPLRRPETTEMVSVEDLQEFDIASVTKASSSDGFQHAEREWNLFKRLLMQRFSVSKTVSISSHLDMSLWKALGFIYLTVMTISCCSTPGTFVFCLHHNFDSRALLVVQRSDIILKSGKGSEKSSTSMHLEDLDDLQKVSEDVKVIPKEEYISRLHELKDDIARAWHADDRVTSLKLSIKAILRLVARLLMDTTASQFYPTVFVLATDILDTLGKMVWERIKQKAEFQEDGSKLCSLPERFKVADVSSDAKETCNNWFCKIGSVKELLPRIYLELAILPCWRFLLDEPVDCLQRLVMMTRGIADPLASSYCCLYLAHCAQKLHPRDMVICANREPFSTNFGAGYLITCINDIKTMLIRMISSKEMTNGKVLENKKLLISLVEPAIEYIMKSLFENAIQRQVSNIILDLGLGGNPSVMFGKFPYISILLHHLLKQLPAEIVSSNAVAILQLIECSKDCSYDQHLNYRLLGFRLFEKSCQIDVVNAVVEKIMQVVTEYSGLNQYLMVVDAYVDIIIQNQMDSYPGKILEDILKRSGEKGAGENESACLQSILMKLLSHFNNLESILALNHFLEVLDMLDASPRGVVNTNILSIATRNYICDPTATQFLFEISQSLHDGIEFPNVKDVDFQQQARLISRFVQMVDYGPEVERHLTFLVDCRGAFGTTNEIKETLVHSSNYLAIKAMRDGKKQTGFVKSCLAFSEVTIPSVSASAKQLNLYLETAEVALLGGLVSHSYGLLDSAFSCLQSSDTPDGTKQSTDVEGLVLILQKICGLLVMVPGNPDLGSTYLPKAMISIVSSYSWITPKFKARILCAVVLLLATLSQSRLPYCGNHPEVYTNDLLFFGDPSYCRELELLSNDILQNLVNIVHQEPSQVTRGNMALETCNCILSSYRSTHEILAICTKLTATAKACSGTNDNFLKATIRSLDEHLSTSQVCM